MGVEFIKYDGKYPCLCFGTLSIKVNNKVYHLKGAMISGGCVWHDADWNFDVEHGAWTVDLSEFPELEQYKEEITDVVNANVGWGCCGGCI